MLWKHIWQCFIHVHARLSRSMLVVSFINSFHLCPMLPPPLHWLSCHWQSSGGLFWPPSACHKSSHKATQHSSCFSFRHIVLHSVFTEWRTIHLWRTSTPDSTPDSSYTSLHDTVTNLHQIASPLQDGLDQLDHFFFTQWSKFWVNYYKFLNVMEEYWNKSVCNQLSPRAVWTALFPDLLI